MLKVIGHIAFIILFLFISFFGIGPVIFADGTMNERIMNLLIIILAYGILIWLYRIFIRKMRKK
ncbi:hypothetical protein KQI38_04345 [Tissierella carlieri]|uniref:DUF6954 family protein n=1 Tax=Tissierella carlieri TaxID=689904 RepID=UPI001C1145EA|nr:hypothetical protein [Tissierella carlieri]MBU5311245.1 hypothetical protein [Tissierella carlieri]MDU5081667.1 hypothetical protein [Bacillota bacterium]